MKNLEYYLNLPHKIELKKIPLNEGGGWGLLLCQNLIVFRFFYGDGDIKRT